MARPDRILKQPDRSDRWQGILRRPILPLAVMLNILAWAMATVVLPFYIGQISGYDAESTLRLIGWALGVTPVLAVATTPLWMRLTRRWDPRTAFIACDVLQGLPLLLLGIAHGIFEVLVMRAALGLGGPANTFAFMIAGRSGGENVRREVAAMQSAVNLGLILGPLAGGLMASRFGYGPVFVIAAMLLWLCAVLVGVVVPRALATPPSPVAGQSQSSARSVSTVCLLILVGYSQVFFLNSVLPTLLPPLGVPASQLLSVTAWILFTTGIVLVVGPLAGPALCDRLGEVRVVVGCLTASSVLLIALGLGRSIWVFSALWLLHVTAIAPVFSVVTARVAQWTSGQALGLVNVFRVVATFLGPVVATMVLSWSSPPVLFGFLGGAGLLSLVAVLPTWRRMCQPTPG